MILTSIMSDGLSGDDQLYIELVIPIPEWFADNGFNDLDSEWDFPPKGHTEQE